MWLLLDKDNPVRLCMHAPGYSCIFGVRVCVCVLNHVQLFETLWKIALIPLKNFTDLTFHSSLQAPHPFKLSIEFSFSTEPLSVSFFQFLVILLHVIQVHFPLMTRQDLLIAVGCKIPFDIWWFQTAYRLIQNITEAHQKRYEDADLDSDYGYMGVIIYFFSSFASLLSDCCLEDHASCVKGLKRIHWICWFSSKKPPTFICSFSCLIYINLI